MLKVRFALALTASALLTQHSFAAPAFSGNTAAIIERTIHEQLASGKVAGVAIQVTQHGKAVLSKGYGTANLEWNTPVREDTVFRIASVTKSITAASILVLAEKGLLSLDDKLSKYLPDFPRANEVTIRQLLTHTSGLVDYPGAYPRKEEWVMQKSMAQMLDIIAHLSPTYHFDPGSDYRYSNSGYYILGFIVEKISGRDLGAFMRENIFSKVGMDDTSMDLAENIVPNRASGYDAVAGQPGKFQNALYFPYTYPGPAGGLRSTVGDLSKWYLALLDGKVIGPELLKEMTTPGSPTQRDYGYGLRAGNQRGHRFLMHTGHISGFNAFAKVFPDDALTIVMLANTSNGLDAFQEQVVDAVLGASPGAAPAPQPAQ
jgi:D-alanyl-D-alanine carboxypeptidase